MIDVGFTGTRSGMSDDQRLAVAHLLELLVAGHSSWRARHGDCLGADAEFHDLARARGATVIGHLPASDADRARRECDQYTAPMPYMRRNREIVLNSSILIAAPFTSAPSLNRPGGTWRTIELAEKFRRPRVVVHRTGLVMLTHAGEFLEVLR